jgi:copper transport protein
MMNCSRHTPWRSVAHRLILMIFPLAFLTFFLFPQDASAHAILLRSDPQKLAVLTTSPAQVNMWFSEDLNPAFSTAFVINAVNSAANNVQGDIRTHVDKHDAQISDNNAREMDVSLKPDLPPAVYLVLYRTQSADDGHILYGYFLFKVAAANGTVPVFNGTIPQPYSSSVTDSGNAQLDGPALFSLIMTTLVDLGAIFWVGAQVWFCFILAELESENQELQTVCEQMQRRFNRGFAWPVLLLVLLADIGVLVGQALSLTGGQWEIAFDPALLISLVNQGHFGTYWILREIVILLALLLAVYMALVKQPSQQITSSITWGNFALGVALLVALTQSGHAAATSSNVLVYAVLADFLHLAAAALWIGGMMYIAVIYLPVLKNRPWQQQTASLLTILPRYSPLAITGVVLMGLSGPLNAATRLLAWDQLFTTVYGLTLIVKFLLVISLLLTSAVHVLFLRPHLAKDFKIYQAATEAAQFSEDDKPVNQASIPVAQLKKLEARTKRQTQELSMILRWEPALGIAVLLCTGLLTVFSGTLQPTATSQPLSQTLDATSKPFTTIVETTDNQLREIASERDKSRRMVY